MSHDDLTPERLDAILDGREAAETDAERDMLALAASMKAAAPRANEGLRHRVRALPTPSRRPGRLRRLVRAGRRGRALVAAPALAAAIAAAIAVSVVYDGSGGSDGAGGGDAIVSESRQDSLQAPRKSAQGGAQDSAAEAVTGALPAAPSRAPTPAVIAVPRGRLTTTLEKARVLVTGAGGRLVQEPEPLGGVRLTITLPPDGRETVLAELARLGDTAAGLGTGGDGPVVVVVREAP